MGDTLPQSTSADIHLAQQAVASSFSAADIGAVASISQSGAPEGQQLYPIQLQQQQQQQQYSSNPQHAFSMQFDMAHSQGAGRGNPYNMNAMSNALPQTNYRQGQQQFAGGSQRFNSPGGASTTAQMQYAMQPGSLNPLMAQQQYYMAQQAQMAQPQYYAPPVSPSHSHGNNMAARAGMGYYQGQIMMNNQQPQQQYYYPQAVHYQTQGMHNQMLNGQYMEAPQSQSGSQYAQQQPAVIHGAPAYVPPSPAEGSDDLRSNVVRGPPRKPKQSGHAIWIGNLPPQTDLMNLVHHVCKEASGLESLFLISKSNCAFANFKDESSCAAAQQKLHESKFQTVRLVSRLRKSTVEGASGVTAPTGPAAASTAQNAGAPVRKSNEEVRTDGEAEGDEDATPLAGPPVVDGDTSKVSTDEVDNGAQQQQPVQLQQQQRDKYFILKSLTVEDLDLSVRTGIWATQAHNEEALNKAFTTTDNVFLVFSANKSGEYFGYARMTSPINDDPAAAIEFAPKASAAAAAAVASSTSQNPTSPSATTAAADLDLPRAIPTEATEFAPRGRIIDDSARGTIFWEAERDDSEDAADDSSSSARSQDAGAGDESPTKAWGKPFKLEWLSTARLPFYRTRGLRNPWNSNREVKIARDGTELEPGVGRRLVGLFNGGGMANRNAGGMVPSAMVMGPGGNGRGMMIPGYPPPRSPYGP